jgi:hypothetical protein
MVYIPSTAGYAAAARIAQQQKEEEEMAKYGSEDLNGWEFKIVRSGSGKFRNQQEVQNLCQEEARSGWEMLEKFDDYRIRFKRKTEMRSSDTHQQIDPYRSYVGMNPNYVGPVIAIFMALLIAGIAFAANYSAKGGKPVILIAPLITIVLIAFIMVFRFRKSRYR